MRNTGNILGLLVLTFLIMACSKEQTPPNLPKGEATITAQIDEEQWEARDFESALSVVPGKGQFFELTASGSRYRMNLSILDFDRATGTISEGTYEEDDIMFSLFLADEDGNYLIEYKPLEEEEDEPFAINVTASTNSRITGTFTGKLYKTSQEEEGYPEFLMITNGLFNNLPFETHTINIQ